jgi:hypothetical protein
MTADDRALIAKCRDVLAASSPDVWWFADRGPAMLEGYTAALDEVERLKRVARDQAARDRSLIGELENYVDQKPSRETLLADNTALRASLTEQAAVIEQQDRDLERMRSFIQLSASPSGKIFRDDMPDLFRESDGNALYIDEARIRLLELGAPCTEATK